MLAVLILVLGAAFWYGFVSFGDGGGKAKLGSEKPKASEQPKASEEPTFGGESALNTLCLGEDTANRVCAGVATGLMRTLGIATTTATTTATWLNNTGNDVIIDYVAMYPTSKASSTFVVWVATSTTATTTLADHNNPIVGGSSASGFPVGGIGVGAYIIASTTIATGTQPVVFKSGVAGAFDVQGGIGAGADGTSGPAAQATSTAATSTIILRNGERIVFGRRAPALSCRGKDTGGIASNVGVICESATSTNATPLRWIVKYYYAQ